MLDGLLEKAGDVTGDGFDPSGADSVLALARHAGRLMGGESLGKELQLRVHAEPMPGGTGQRDWLDRFEHSPVEGFLDGGPARSLLIGLPGAGKSYAVRRSAARLAEELYKACLLESFELESVVVPVMADLKMYRGNLTELVDQALPAGLPVRDVVVAAFQDEGLPRLVQRDAAAIPGERDGRVGLREVRGSGSARHPS